MTHYHLYVHENLVSKYKIRLICIKPPGNAITVVEMHIPLMIHFILVLGAVAKMTCMTILVGRLLIPLRWSYVGLQGRIAWCQYGRVAQASALENRYDYFG